MKQQIYIDTSVIGGCLDDEFKDISIQLIDKAKQGQIKLMVSDITELELIEASQEVQDILKAISNDNIVYVELTEEASSLAGKYISEGIISEGKLADAEHIAIATINRADVLLEFSSYCESEKNSWI